MNQTSIALLLAGSLSVACGAAEDTPATQNDAASRTAQPERGEVSDRYGNQFGDPNVSDELAPGETLQTPEEAAAQDAQLIAEANGWTLEQYAQFQAGVDAIGKVQERVAAERPEMFVGGAVGPEYDATPRLYIKGPADDFVRALVAAAPIAIALIDEQPFSFDEIGARNARVGSLLRDMGFSHYAVGSDIERRAVMEIEVVPAPGAPETPEAVRAALPPEYRRGVEISFGDASGFTDD